MLMRAIGKPEQCSQDMSCDTHTCWWNSLLKYRPTIYKNVDTDLRCQKKKAVPWLCVSENIALLDLDNNFHIQRPMLETIVPRRLSDKSNLLHTWKQRTRAPQSMTGDALILKWTKQGSIWIASRACSRPVGSRKNPTEYPFHQKRATGRAGLPCTPMLPETLLSEVNYPSIPLG